MVSPLRAFRRACRRVPGPLSAVLVTTRILPSALVGVGTGVGVDVGLGIGDDGIGLDVSIVVGGAVSSVGVDVLAGC